MGEVKSLDFNHHEKNHVKHFVTTISKKYMNNYIIKILRILIITN